jgi:hypothetical protein
MIEALRISSEVYHRLAQINPDSFILIRLARIFHFNFHFNFDSTVAEAEE